MEYLDVLNEDGSLAGHSLSRKEVHEKGLWHRAAHIWILRPNGELLIQKRSMKKTSSPGKWDVSAAGHLSSGETSLEGAIKEIREEVGLSILPEELVKLGTTKKASIQNNGTYFNNQFSDIYILQKELALEDLKMQESEVDEIRFIHWKDLKKIVDANDPTFVPHEQEFVLLFDFLAKTFD